MSDHETPTHEPTDQDGRDHLAEHAAKDSTAQGIANLMAEHMTVALACQSFQAELDRLTERELTTGEQQQQGHAALRALSGWRDELRKRIQYFTKQRTETLN